MARFRSTLCILTLGAAAVSACGPSRSEGAAPPPVEPAVRFAKDLDELESWLVPKGRPLVVNHWATWCGPCVDEFPYLADVARRFAGDCDFVGVAWDNLRGKATQPGAEQEAVRAAIDKVRRDAKASFAVVVAPPDISALAKRFSLPTEAVPQTYVFAKDGRQIFSFRGELEDDADKRRFEEAIRGASKD